MIFVWLDHLPLWTQLFHSLFDKKYSSIKIYRLEGLWIYLWSRKERKNVGLVSRRRKFNNSRHVKHWRVWLYYIASSVLVNILLQRNRNIRQGWLLLKKRYSSLLFLKKWCSMLLLCELETNHPQYGNKEFFSQNFNRILEVDFYLFRLHSFTIHPYKSYNLYFV